MNNNFFNSCILFIIIVSPAHSQEKALPQRLSLGYEIGNWQPHSLNDEPRFTTFGAAGATPFMGLTLLVPLSSDFGIRTSIGFWSLRDLNEVESVHSLTLHIFSVDLKYWLVPDYNLSAFVMYGGGIYWGVENNESPFGDRIRMAKQGWGANLGAGFDFAFTRHWAIGMVFQYHYVRFKESLGGVDDFSGPKITGIVTFLF
jgi:hypothetical protein